MHFGSDFSDFGSILASILGPKRGGTNAGFRVMLALGAKTAPRPQNCPQLGPTCPNLAPTWLQIGPNLAQLGPNLAPTCPNLAPTWLNMASTWLQHGTQNRYKFKKIWYIAKYQKQRFRVDYLSKIKVAGGQHQAKIDKKSMKNPVKI